MATLLTAKELLGSLVNCEDLESRRLIGNELTRAIATTIEQVVKETSLEERKILVEHLDVEIGASELRLQTKQVEPERGKTSTIFFPFVVPPQVKAIDPRDTVARALCGDRANRFLFNIYFRHQTSAAVILAMAITGGVCLLLGLTGIVPSEVSWGAFMLCPFLLCFFAMLNRHLLHVLRREFEFWVLLILSSVSCASFIDMVWNDPQRIVAVVFLFACSIALVTSDARPAFRKKAYGYRLVFVGATLVYAFILALYHANVWEDFRSTVYHIGIGRGIDFHVASTGMGCAMTLCVLTGKYAYVILRSSEVNPMVVIRASIVLRPFAKGSKPTPQQSPHAVLRRASVPIVSNNETSVVVVSSPSTLKDDQKSPADATRPDI